MNDEIDYYALLHVSADAPEEIIRASYRTLMQKLGAHPDLGGDHGYAQLLNQAYTVLKDPLRRRDYDAARGHRREPEPEPARSATADNCRTQDTGMYQTVSETGTWAGPMSPEICILERCPFCATDVPDGPAQPSTHCRRCGSPLVVAEQKVFDDSSRRAMRRISKNEPIRYRTNWRQREFMTGRMLDLSLTGLRIAIDQELAINQRLAIDCSACEGVGKVAHCRQAGTTASSGYTIGVEFLTLDFKHRKGSLFAAPA